MAKKRDFSIEFSFFQHLWEFYALNKGRIRKHYRDLTKRYLDYNDPTNSHAFLRLPQFEALEMYVFLKEFLDNQAVHKIFEDWAENRNHFKGRCTSPDGTTQLGLFEFANKEEYQAVFERMKAGERIYPNYIFALTMGTGKTILMATCIFYEFILANKFPKDEKYCHNALVFAPDKTVLQSLKEIQTFEMAKVVPPEYASFLSTHIQFHFLDDTGISLNLLDRSRFNLIISNTQKIILKRQSKEKTAAERLFGSGSPTYQPDSVYSEYQDLYGFDEPDDEVSLITNQRFEKLRRIEQLGIYVDEAHHAFGTNLARDVGAAKDTRKTSLRLTIDELAASLEKTGTKVVACYNYTGTPYVKNQVLPEVVYAFGLQEAIDKEYLKKVNINGYKNPKSTEFVQAVVNDFVENERGSRYEGMLAKIAFFAPTIDDLQNELRPAVEKALAKHDIPPTSVLVNVGDPKLTSNDDIREFNRLDTETSQKEFILLVNKGREGWNCRSLFGVALYRKPKSKIFVLQATMRCLRSIGEGQQTGRIYLSEENIEILDKELEQNFHLSVDEMTGIGKKKQNYQIKPVPPPVKLTLQRVRRKFEVVEKELQEGIDLELDQIDYDKYRLIHTEHEGLVAREDALIMEEDLSHLIEQREYSQLTLVAEIARYLNMSPLKIEKILEESVQGTQEVIKVVNEFNELLYDWIIPRLFHGLYDTHTEKSTEEYEVDLIKEPEDGYYSISAEDELVAQRSTYSEMYQKKSFHLDTYCFDSKPEKRFFFDMVRDGKVQKIYFTGMLTHGQSDFFIQYIDPESNSVRSYYPDFLFQKEDGSYVIVEVKGDHQVEDPVVLAKQEFAEQMAVASGMTYHLVRESQVKDQYYTELFE